MVLKKCHHYTMDTPIWQEWEVVAQRCVPQSALPGAARVIGVSIAPRDRRAEYGRFPFLTLLILHLEKYRHY